MAQDVQANSRLLELNNMDTNLSRPLLSEESNGGEPTRIHQSAPSRLFSEGTLDNELRQQHSSKAILRRQNIRRFHDSDLLMVETEPADTDRLFSLKAARLAKKTVGVGVKSLFGKSVLRQEWIEQKDGSFRNSSNHEHRSVKWMDILFDLALVGFQLHVWKLMTQHFAMNSILDGFVIAIVGYSFLMAIWKHVTLERNLYHGGGWRDTALIFVYLFGLIVTINGMHTCVQRHTCGDTLFREGHAHGQCTLFAGGALACCLLASFTSFLRSQCGPSKRMSRPHAIEAVLFLFAALPWCAILMEKRPKNVWEGTFVCICAILPIAAPPFIHGLCCPRWLRHSFQPVHIGYFLERVGLCVIVNLAVMIESTIADLCDDLAPEKEFCSSHHRRLSGHSHGTGDVHNHTVADPLEGNDASGMQLLKVQGILMVILVKCLYFNVYRPSQAEENASESRYSFFVDFNVILITLLAIGLSLWSSENHLAICSHDYHIDTGKFPRYDTQMLATTGTVCLFIAFTLWHVLHTRNGFRHEGKGVSWTPKTFLSVCAIRITSMVLCIVLQRFYVGKDGEVFIFIGSVLLFLLVEEKFLHSPILYGRKLDVQLALQEEEKEKNTEMDYE